jgi:hypothetical protein
MAGNPGTSDTKNDESFLEDARALFDKAAEAEDENRKDAVDDLKFARLAQQWPDRIKEHRQREHRPCLTINKCPAFIRQVVNDARQNKPAIKVRPVDSAADLKTAEVMSGLIRNIEYTSNAEVAYDTATDFAVTMGFGYIRVKVDYAHDDTFDKDLLIERVANPFSVYGDPASEAADSSDWNHAFVTKMLEKDEFGALYKGADEVDWADVGYGDLSQPWFEDDFVMVAEHWKREVAEKKLLMLSDGTPIPEEAFLEHRDEFAAIGVMPAGPERMVRGHKIKHWLMTGAEVLEENDWPGRYIPIIPVYGEEVNSEGKRYFRSLIRDAKDAQRNFNYWRTSATELVALAPKAPFIGEEGAFDVDPEKWASANVESHAYLEYARGKGPPQRQPFAGVPAGALQEALNSSDDMKAIMGLHDASLGARSNEVSGRAIIARQREGDVSTFHFLDNLSRAIRHTGRVLIDLIPHVYTGERVIRVLGPEGAVSKVPLNVPIVDQAQHPGQAEPGQTQQPGAPGGQADAPAPQIYNFTMGKYDLAVETGPSFTTRREEAATQMIELMRAFPAAASVLGDLLAKNLDWPGADEIAKRLQSINPAAQKGNPEMARMGQMIRQLTARLQALAADKTLEAQKLAIETRKADNAAFDSETKRLDVLAKNQPVDTEALVNETIRRILDGPDIAPGIASGPQMAGPGIAPVGTVPPNPNGGGII